MKTEKQKLNIEDVGSLELEKLRLEPGDILVVNVPRGMPHAVERIHQLVRKILPPSTRSIVKGENIGLERLADIITPEELHMLNVAMEKRLLEQNAAGLPRQQMDTAPADMNR
jgi:hypothetical protein